LSQDGHAHQTLHLLLVEGTWRPLGHCATGSLRTEVRRRRDKRELVTGAQRQLLATAIFSRGGREGGRRTAGAGMCRFGGRTRVVHHYRDGGTHIGEATRPALADLLKSSSLGGGSELPLGGPKTESKMLDDSLLCRESSAGDKNRSQRRQLAVILVPLYAPGQRLCKRFDVRGDMSMESCAGQAPCAEVLRFPLSEQRMRCVTLCAEGLVAWG
jgi:hypothetical protein